MSKQASKTITCGSGVTKEIKPFVEVTSSALKHSLQLTPADARSLAANLLCAAEAAEQDAFMVTFAKDKIGLPMSEAAGLLKLYRQWRNQPGAAPAE